ncbi:ABC transporter ATP-binding protein [uncultured Clostridium sp.]|uniref:ABC transporter ATP-binding protein n=1 Tax=uncultured Clostridium sp. TaxID=59620 RepID=UPI00262B46B9|nr:ABC transporter ATP-binding protein [uncultured Clostridium sp.]
MKKILEINGIKKSYGKKNVLKGINFSLESGKTLGILGPNGNGKTTLLNIIGGLLQPDEGEILIDNISISSESKKIVSYLRENNQLYSWMKIEDAISFYKDFFEDFDEERTRKLLKFMNIEGNQKLKALSKGMVEKVSLSLVLGRRAKLYILDEPISGVDILSRDEIINAIVQNMIEGASMIITTHYVGELERLLDEVLFIKDGIIVEKGEADSIREKYETSIEGAYKEIFKR